LRCSTAFLNCVGTADSVFSDEAQLLFYALHSQATNGPCTDGKPWVWNIVESAKWQSWSQLGNMPQMEAMRLYVRTLDEEQVRIGCRVSAA
jgi:acyl-CoA-binding protein